MPVREFKALADAGGGRIELRWINPRPGELPAPFRGVKLLRREGTRPTRADVGTARQIFDDGKATANEPSRYLDAGLKGNTVYYYAIVPYDASSNLGALVHASELSTSSYAYAEQLFARLPALYRRLDVAGAQTPLLDPADRGKGQLQRLLETVGPQLDLLRSYIEAGRDLTVRERVDGALLPLLADWIGWPTDHGLPFAKQRNEIAYAPHYFRTTGTAPNLRATINRVTTWDARFKEFVHNVLLANAPPRLAVWEQPLPISTGAPRLITLDTAYEGRPAAVRASDGRSCLFYHALETGHASSPKLRAQLWLKVFDLEQWLPSQRLTFDDALHKYPAAIQRRDGSWCLASSAYSLDEVGAPEIRLRAFDIGCAPTPARLQGQNPGPFNLQDGDGLRIAIQNGGTTLTRSVTVHREHFANLAAATATELAALLDRELPGVEVRISDDGALSLTTASAGSGSDLNLLPSQLTTKLGSFVKTAGTDGRRAQLDGNLSAANAPFQLVGGDTLAIAVDAGAPVLVSFKTKDFFNIALATAAEVAATINATLPGVASAVGGRIRLTSPQASGRSLIGVDLNASSAAGKLGFGLALPPASPTVDDTEPALFEDNGGNLWVFWSSRRPQSSVAAWRIWYNRRTQAGWGTPKLLTSGAVADREPAVVFDPAGGGSAEGKIWLFWTREKSNGRRNIFWRTTSKLDFDTLLPSDWAEAELTPVPADSDRAEAAPILRAPSEVELYFGANAVDGWHVWTTAFTPLPAAPPTQLDSGPFTRRAPAVLGGPRRQLFFRADDSHVYVSRSYPAAETLDERHVGSTTVDTRNAARIALQGKFRDIFRYTYDTGQRPQGLEEREQFFARDTIGIYLTPDTDDEQLILSKQGVLANIVRSYLPIQVRPLFIIQQGSVELVYTNSRPDISPPRVIDEEWYDITLSDIVPTAVATFQDQVNFRFVRSWSPALRNVSVVDVRVSPPDLTYRVFMQFVQEGP